MTATAITAKINATADDPSVAVYLPIPLAETLIHMAGGYRPSTIEARRRGMPYGVWAFPDAFWTWATDEATRYALEVMPDVLDA